MGIYSNLFILVIMFRPSYFPTFFRYMPSYSVASGNFKLNFTTVVHFSLFIFHVWWVGGYYFISVNTHCFFYRTRGYDISVPLVSGIKIINPMGTRYVLVNTLGQVYLEPPPPPKKRTGVEILEPSIPLIEQRALCEILRRSWSSKKAGVYNCQDIVGMLNSMAYNKHWSIK